MSDYYISNRTYFLSGSKIFSSEGSGSGADKTNGVEMTTTWFYNTGSNNITIMDIFEISKQVSGSYYYLEGMEF